MKGRLLLPKVWTPSPENWRAGNSFTQEQRRLVGDQSFLHEPDCIGRLGGGVQ